MSELDEFDLDRTVKRAWAVFQTRLADHVAAMADDDVVLVELGGADPTEGAAPYVQLEAAGGDLVRCEVSSNAHLDPLFALDARAERVLVELGWSTPTYGVDDEPDSGSSNFHLDLERSYADRLAAMTVRAFRDVWSVAHPAFLVADALGDTPPDLDVGRSPDAEPPPLPEVAHPQGRDELQRVVDETLAVVFGHPPQKDTDGDIPVRSGSALVFVRVRPDAPVVEVFAPLVRDITGRTRAAEVVADLNRESTLIKFVLLDDAVLAVISLLATPFVPAHLHDMLAMLSQTADDIDDGLAERLNGRLMFDESTSGLAASDRDGPPMGVTDEETAGGLPPQLQTLVHLDPHGVGAVDAATAAKVCGHDRDQILSFLKICSQEEISWRQRADTAAAAGDREEADASNHEAAAWEQTVETLRGALRFVVTSGPSGRAAPGGWTQQQALFPDPERPTLFDEPGE